MDRQEFWFEKNPKKALLLVVGALFLVIDLFAGTLYFRVTKGSLAYRRDQRFHHTLKSNYKGKQRWGGLRYELITNSEGFKDKERREVKKEAENRIALLGDSFVEGPGIPFEQTVAGHIREQLGGQTPVLSMGTSSHSPKLYHARLKNLLDRGFEFSHVYLFIDVSDILDEVRYASFDPGLDERSEDKWYTRMARINAWLLHHSVVYSQLAYEPLKSVILPWLLERSQMAEHDDFKEIAELSVHAYEYYDARGLWLYQPSFFDQWGRVGMLSAQHYVDQIFDRLTQEGISMTLVIYPWSDHVAFLEEYSLQQQQWEYYAQRRGIPLIDLFKKTAAYQGDSSELFIPGDIHWSQKGHQFVADNLLEERALSISEESAANQQAL